MSGVLFSRWGIKCALTRQVAQSTPRHRCQTSLATSIHHDPLQAPRINGLRPQEWPQITYWKESELSYHWDTSAPSPAQLSYAEKFFLKGEPTLLFIAAKFRMVSKSTGPEVVFLGRSNVGKSSLLNALMASNLCYTSKKPGRTRTMNAFAVGGEDGRGNQGRLTILDMPGYGKGSHAEWGKEIMDYLCGRKELRRAFLLVDPSHGIKSSDKLLLQLLRQNAIPHQVILSKVDRVLFPRRERTSELKLRQNLPKLHKIMEDMKKTVQPNDGGGPGALGELISCSAEKSLGKRKRIGIDNLRWAVLTAVGLNNPIREPFRMDNLGLEIEERPPLISESIKSIKSS